MIGIGLKLACVAAAMLACAQTSAQTWKVPEPAQRCPSKWGAQDERGSGNLMGSRSVLRARDLIRTGESFELAFPLDANAALGPRRFDVYEKQTVLNKESNQRGSNEEVVFTELGQVGTQFDGFAHQSHGTSHYNCVDTKDVIARNGVKKFGMQNVGMLMTRGVLLDIAGLKGVATLPDTYEVTVADLEAAMTRQKVKLEAGDAVLIHTGWGRLYGKENARFLKSEPGIGVAAGEYLAKFNPMIVGADSSAVEVLPNPDPLLNAPVHQLMLVVHGIHLLENLKLDELAAKQVYEFAFMLQPIKAAMTGSTVAPVAVR